MRTFLRCCCASFSADYKFLPQFIFDAACDQARQTTHTHTHECATSYTFAASCQFWPEPHDVNVARALPVCAIKLACTSAAASSAGNAANDDGDGDDDEATATTSGRRRCGRQPFDQLPNCNWNAKVLRAGVATF